MNVVHNRPIVQLDNNLDNDIKEFIDNATITPMDIKTFGNDKKTDLDDLKRTFDNFAQLSSSWDDSVKQELTTTVNDVIEAIDNEKTDSDIIIGAEDILNNYKDALTEYKTAYDKYCIDYQDGDNYPQTIIITGVLPPTGTPQTIPNPNYNNWVNLVTAHENTINDLETQANTWRDQVFGYFNEYDFFNRHFKRSAFFILVFC